MKTLLSPSFPLRHKITVDL